MESEIKVSVIVPIYNAEKFIHKCINSLINQTYKDLEILLIDDGSTDNSYILCKEYSQKDKRVRLIHKENGGVSIARNYGIEKACGDFIMFVDSDDWLEADACEKLVNNAVSRNADIVFCNYCVKQIEGDKTKSTLKDHNHGNCEIIGQHEILKLAEKLAFAEFCFHGSSSVCTKIWRREFLIKNNILFEAGRTHGEDWYFVMEALCVANKIAFIKDSLYVYTYYKSIKKEFLRNSAKQKTFNELMDTFEKFKKRFPKFDYNSKEYYEFCYRGIFNLQVDILKNVRPRKEGQRLLKEINNDQRFLYILSKLHITNKQNKRQMTRRKYASSIKVIVKKLIGRVRN